MAPMVTSGGGVGSLRTDRRSDIAIAFLRGGNANTLRQQGAFAESFFCSL